MEYTMEMTGDDPDRLDTIVDADGATVIVENRALFYVLGSEIDFIDTPVTTEFVFKNPNASGMCGCGSTIRRFRCCVCLCGCCCCFCFVFQTVGVFVGSLGDAFCALTRPCTQLSLSVHYNSLTVSFSTD